MIRLDYNLEPSALQRLEDVELASVTQTQLDYYLFTGDVTFRADGASFDAPWGWVPVLGFARQLCHLAHTIELGCSATLEFTESDAQITLVRVGEQIHLTSNYTQDDALVPARELKQEACRFVHKMTDDLIAQWPALAQSQAMQEIRGSMAAPE